jgi:hypothetical protein
VPTKSFGKNESHQVLIFTQFGREPMEILKKIDGIVEEIKEEATSLKIAKNHAEEVEALKEIFDLLMRGAHEVQEKIDQYNDRRYRS